MKKLLLAAALLLSAAAADAGTVFYQPNEAGGVIALTDSACVADDSMFLAYGRAPGGTTIFGCWVYSAADRMFFVVWQSGDTKTYPASTMTVTDYGYRTYGGEHAVSDNPEIAL